MVETPRLTDIARSAASTGIGFEPLADRHFALVAQWFGRPHVAQWWHDGPRTAAAVEAEYLAPLGKPDAAIPYVAIARGEPIGFIQTYVAVDFGQGWWTGWDDPSVRGIDQFLADERSLGCGLGTAMIGAFVSWLLDDATVSKVVVDPSPRNARAFGCYRKCGFRDAGIIATPDGEAMLMELLRPRE